MNRGELQAVEKNFHDAAFEIDRRRNKSNLLILVVTNTRTF
jgi:hypothetical protein